MSFMNMAKVSTFTHPWGTIDGTCVKSAWKSSIKIYWLQSLSYDWIQWSNCPLMVWVFSLGGSCWWGTQLDTLDNLYLWDLYLYLFTIPDIPGDFHYSLIQ